jgi:hypothetical protein
MIDMGAAGMFALFVDEADGGGFRFEEWPLANSYFAASVPGGPVDTVFNEFPLTAEQAVNDYGEEMVSEKIRKLVADGKPDEVIAFVRCGVPAQGSAREAHEESAGRVGATSRRTRRRSCASRATTSCRWACRAGIRSLARCTPSVR